MLILLKTSDRLVSDPRMASRMGELLTAIPERIGNNTKEMSGIWQGRNVTSPCGF